VPILDTRREIRISWFTVSIAALKCSRTKRTTYCYKPKVTSLKLTSTAYVLEIDSVRVRNFEIASSTYIKNLGAWFDEKLSMATHVTKICSAPFFKLYNIRRIRRYLTQDSAETLIHSFITNKVDYCNSLLYGLPACQLDKLQRVQHAAASLVFNELKFCHIAPLLIKLQWLSIRFRIESKMLLITYNAIHNLF